MYYFFGHFCPYNSYCIELNLDENFNTEFYG